VNSSKRFVVRIIGVAREANIGPERRYEQPFQSLASTARIAQASAHNFTHIALGGVFGNPIEGG